MALRKSEFLLSRLTSCLHDPSWSPGGLLPPIRHLAQQWGTSPVTVMRVLKRAVEQGVVEALPHQGGYCRPGARSDGQGVAVEYDRRNRPREIAASLKNDILEGIYLARGTLPTLKELQARFSCSHATARAALELVVGAGLATRRGGTFAPRSAPAAAAARTHVFLAGDPRLVDPQRADTLEVIRAADRELVDMGGDGLRYFWCTNPARSRATAPADHRVAGFLYFLFIDDKGWHRFLVRRPGLPVALVNIPAHEFRSFEALRRFACFTPDHRGAGVEVATHLRAFGHKRVAFLAPGAVSEPWARLRLDGLREVYPEASHGADCSLRILHPAAPAAGDTWRAVRSQIDKTLRVITKLPGMDHGTAAGAFAPAYSLCESATVAEAMQRVFAEALADRTLTAWVCLNDALAGMALDFLRARGVRVPRRLSVVGFDNSPLSYRRGLTSYDFGYTRIGALAGRWFADPSIAKLDANRTAHVGGHLPARSSSGPTATR